MSALLQDVLQSGNYWFLLLVFASVTFFTFAISSMTSTWMEVRRRASQTAVLPAGPGFTAAASSRSLDAFLPKSQSELGEVRKFLSLAGYYGARAPAIYQLIRIATAFAFGILTGLLYGGLFPDHPFFAGIGAAMMMALLGFMLPRSVVSLQRDSLCEEHRQGFPDFLDLLVICIEAGIGIESAIDRVSQDLARSYPSLARNLTFMSLELRAGSTTRVAMANLGERLGIDEARSFATLIQQSEELGSSLVQSLRVYSDEMRDKRLARAEEKAHALPVKLVVPLGLFIFPVIFGVTLLPVALKIYKALGISGG